MIATISRYQPQYDPHFVLVRFRAVASSRGRGIGRFEMPRLDEGAPRNIKPKKDHSRYLYEKGSGLVYLLVHQCLLRL